MARAIEMLRPGELAGLAPVDDGAGFRYQLAEAGGRARLVETYANGSRPHRESSSIDFAIGAGSMDRSYVVKKYGRMWFAPVEVVTQDHAGGRAAAPAPFLSMQPGSRLTQEITPECLACHTDAPPPRDWPLNVRPGAETWEPTGISCGACHTHLDEHVAWRSAELVGEDPEGPDPTLDHGELGRTEQMSVCAACHLQGDARIELDANRMGPPEPGGDLLQTRAVFVAAEPTGDVGFVSQTERLVLSRCYLESESMSCVTCHDPHLSLAGERERLRVRSACESCHDAHALTEPAPDTDCVACHMQKTRVFDVADVEIHDHWIRSRPDPPGTPGPLRFPESPDGTWRRFVWPGVEPPEHVADPGLEMMALSFSGHAARALQGADEAPGAVVAALPMYHHVRAGILEGAGRENEARTAYEVALELDPRLAESLSNLGLLLGRLGAEQEGVALLGRLIALHPEADGAYRNRAVLKNALGDTRGAVQDLEQAMRLHPDAALAQVLARVYAQHGRADLERRWSDEARRLDPRDLGESGR